ncbi:SBBP repeat-containing protein [Mechercharimyces sp. CAU 1602]|uniref:SBBP repeat-containing protein n=1 Tax=Mechercharimyces sp. CAU 1602 TaxID=2973933 RepID=UPI002162FCF7|nr:SBBP repeat-containing protein [Mechercharimyces sp. CAU 1602]MCS1352160.1 SBBP repeat-containing protein [Mechercharimyces sp. CAU 1602]
MNPIIVLYSTYLGGSSADCGNAITSDEAGFTYITGLTDSTNFPVTSGAFQTIFPDACSVFVAKLNQSGSGIVYATYLGGERAVNIGSAIAVDDENCAYVTGETGSTQFPVSTNAFQSQYPGGDASAFVSKLNATGTSLVFSSYLGGNQNDFGNGIAVDKEKATYVTGITASSNFPVTSSSLQTQFSGGGFDAYVTKINQAGRSLLYSTFLGGTKEDFGFAIALDENGSAYITGETCSTNFPTTTGAFQTQFAGQGNSNAFVSKIDATGSQFNYSSFLGGTSRDYGAGIAVDVTGAAYVTGGTQSGNFPISSSAFQTQLNAIESAFVTKVNPNGSQLAYSSFLGGTFVNEGNGIQVDAQGQAWVTGSTESIDFPVTPTAFQRTQRGDTSAFLSQVNLTGSKLLYSTYIGGSRVTMGRGVGIDSMGSAYVTGDTTSTNFPTTPGALEETFQSAIDTPDAYVIKIGTFTPVGITGATGATGEQGMRGPRGARGVRGESGSGR